MIFDDQERTDLSGFSQSIQGIATALSSLERRLTDEELTTLFNNINIPSVSGLDGIAVAFTSFGSRLTSEGFVSASETRPFHSFASALKKRSSQENFIKHIFKNGFCELPLELIQAFQEEADVQWGGMWNGNNVDYMHFEIKKSEIAKYLEQLKP